MGYLGSSHTRKPLFIKVTTSRQLVDKKFTQTFSIVWWVGVVILQTLRNILLHMYMEIVGDLHAKNVSCTQISISCKPFSILCVLCSICVNHLAFWAKHAAFWAKHVKCFKQSLWELCNPISFKLFSFIRCFRMVLQF